MDQILPQVKESQQQERQQQLAGLKHIATFIRNELNEGFVSEAIAQRVRLQDTTLITAARFLADCYRASPDDTLDLLLALDAIAQGEETDYKMSYAQETLFRRAVFTAPPSRPAAPFGTDDHHLHAEALSTAAQAGSPQWSKRDVLRLLRNAGAAGIIGGALVGIPTYEAEKSSPRSGGAHTSRTIALDDYFGLNGQALTSALITAGMTGSLSGMLIAAAHADKKSAAFRSVRDEAYNILKPLEAVIDGARYNTMVHGEIAPLLG